MYIGSSKPDDIAEYITDTRLQTPDFRHQTSDTRLQTQDFRHKTSDTRLQTQDFRHKTSDTRLQTQDKSTVRRVVKARRYRGTYHEK